MNNVNTQFVYFIHVPRTAGTYITRFLFKQLGEKFVREGHTVPPHALHPWTERFGPTHFEKVDKKDCLTFSVLRNPFDLLVSMYLFGFPYWSPRTVAGRQQIVWPFSSFRDYVTKLCTWDDYPWICPEQKKSLFFQLFDANGDCLADTILRYELLQEGLQALGAQLGHKWHPPAGRFQATKPHNYRDFYDEELIRLVETRFAADLETFGYGFDRHDGQAVIDGTRCHLAQVKSSGDGMLAVEVLPTRQLTGPLADKNFHPWDEAILQHFSGKQLMTHLRRRVSKRFSIGSATERGNV